MQYRILSKYIPGDIKEYYWVQCRKHWWNRWIEAPIIGFIYNQIRKQGHIYFDNIKDVFFIKENLKKFVKKYKGFTIYPVFDYKNFKSLNYTFKGFICINNDYHNCVSNDIIQITWNTIDEVKKFIDDLKNNKPQIKIIKK